MTKSFFCGASHERMTDPLVAVRPFTFEGFSDDVVNVNTDDVAVFPDVSAELARYEYVVRRRRFPSAILWAVTGDGSSSCWLRSVEEVP